jgi:hypothetical protein
MAQDAIISLETLQCIREDDHNDGSEPYLWPVLIRIDDATLQTPGLVRLVAPPSSDARVVIKDSMLAGQTADIPASVGLLSTRLEDNLFDTRLILIVALLEEDDTPEHAVRAGYVAFVDALGAVFGQFSTLLDLKNAEDALQAAQDANDPAAIQAAEAQKAAVIKGIEDEVKARVKSAIEDELTPWEKGKVLAHLLNLDDTIDSNFKSFSQAFPAQFSLSFVNGSSENYVIRGRLRLRQIVVDNCQAQVEAVKRAQTAVNNVLNWIKQLQAELRQASGPEKPIIIAEIRRVRREELAEAQTALNNALTALSICRVRIPATFPDTATTG